MFYDLYKDAITFNKTDGSKETADVIGGSGEGGTGGSADVSYLTIVDGKLCMNFEEEVE